MDNVITTVAILAAIFATALYLETKRDAEQDAMTYERLITELKNVPQVDCVSETKPEKPYTYDQWVTDKPCPPGRRGPLCHMDASDYQ